ncbi:hypothetical protein EVAR_12676_1 [Eumeta japonica]|uniref:Uncharacterized protein n=1 Tax=Eumeta variegata TaxID=151549 RepID=A0A4C1YZU1_EUMVA|nr:hypothetical protein EVAR_12676_1 [Eumeta japonica]
MSSHAGGFFDKEGIPFNVRWKEFCWDFLNKIRKKDLVWQLWRCIGQIIRIVSSREKRILSSYCEPGIWPKTVLQKNQRRGDLGQALDLRP